MPQLIMYASEDTISIFTRYIDDKEIQIQGVFLPDTHDAYKENFSGLPIFQVQELTIRESESNLSELTDKEHYPVDPADIINANNQFALNFYSKISQNDNESNIFFSPTSISTAFSILYEGTREDTAKEIQNVFGFPENELERKHGYLSLHNSINDKSNNGTQLQIANALWLARNFEPLPEYIDTATTYYDSTVSSVDFVSDDGVNKINDWVKTKTNDKIKELLKPWLYWPYYAHGNN